MLLQEKILVKFSTHLDYISSCKKESSKPKLELRDLRTRSVRGLVVMIVACQVMDPGSIPGERTSNFADSDRNFAKGQQERRETTSKCFCGCL